MFGWELTCQNAANCHLSPVLLHYQERQNRFEEISRVLACQFPSEHGREHYRLIFRVDYGFCFSHSSHLAAKPRCKPRGNIGEFLRYSDGHHITPSSPFLNSCRFVHAYAAIPIQHSRSIGQFFTAAFIESQPRFFRSKRVIRCVCHAPILPRPFYVRHGQDALLKNKRDGSFGCRPSLLPHTESSSRWHSTLR